MTPDHESSYYEIALTNRQVLTIFVVLLTCLVAAFLSGVWIGRRDGAEGMLQTASSTLPVEQASAQLTELNFFSDAPPRKAGSNGGQPSAPPPETGGKARPAEPPPEPAAAIPDRGAPATPPRAEPPPPTAADPAPPPARPAITTPAAGRPVAADPPSPDPAGATAAAKVIQVFSTPDSTQARRLVQRLGAGGYPVFLLQEQLEGQTTYRVRVGPYSQETEARRIADELRRDYRLETWITSQG